MVHGVAEQSDGRFTLQSRLGEGTTAKLWLPLAPPLAETIDQSEGSADGTTHHGSLTVIAVDDDFLVLTNTVAMLEDLGHTALPASSGKEALEILRCHDAVDAIVTDQGMPHMTGLQLVEAIQKEWPKLSIIIATGYAELGLKGRSDLQRLSKPFTEVDLRKALADVVSKSNARMDAA
jgi:CheY-like chemotaxis protein